MTITDLTERRAEAETRLMELRAQRGVAMLDGNSFSDAEIDSLEHELAGLNEAEGEAVRRERAATASERQKRLAELRKQLTALEATRLGAVQDANTSARTLAESIESVLSVNAEMAKIAHEFTGGKVSVMMMESDLVSRLSGRLSAVMGSITGYRNRFGGIEWRGASLYRPVDDWRACEAALMEPHLEPLMEKETENGKS
jgi:ribosomal protein L29